jgi:hypothetical protein
MQRQSRKRRLTPQAMHRPRAAIHHDVNRPEKPYLHQSPVPDCTDDRTVNKSVSELQASTGSATQATHKGPGRNGRTPPRRAAGLRPVLDLPGRSRQILAAAGKQQTPVTHALTRQRNYKTPGQSLLDTARSFRDEWTPLQRRYSAVAAPPPSLRRSPNLKGSFP